MLPHLYNGGPSRCGKEPGAIRIAVLGLVRPKRTSTGSTVTLPRNHRTGKTSHDRRLSHACLAVAGPAWAACSGRHVPTFQESSGPCHLGRAHSPLHPLGRRRPSLVAVRHGG